MKDRPIPFSAPMIRAILAGRKTQTRRALKPDLFLSASGAVVRMASAGPATTGIAEAHCPYWREPGDRLWVREAFRLCAEADSIKPRDTDAAYRIWYEADAPHQPGFGKLRPAMFMPRWASRITLKVTGVSVERLQDISEADAIAEGTPGGHGAIPGYAYNSTPGEHYRHLWDSINGPGSWSANPLVWVIEFERMETAQ